MPVGLQVFDASGVLVVDQTDHVARLLTYFRITAAGSTYQPGFLTGDPFYVYVPDNSSGTPPLFTYDGSGTLSWGTRGGVAGIGGWLYLGVR